MNKIDTNINIFKNACSDSELTLSDIKVKFVTLDSSDFIKLEIKANWFNKSEISNDLDKLISILKTSTSSEFQKKVFSITVFNAKSYSLNEFEILGFRAIGIEH